MLLLGVLKENLIAFVIWIASGLYNVAAFVFQIFLVLSTNELVSSDVYKQMYSNFYAVLGVIILFFLTFSFLKAMVDPDNDKVGTSAVKQIVINLATSTIIMALLPTIFGFLYDMQHAILVNQNTIGRFFNYGAIDSQASATTSQISRGSFQIVNGVYTAFFNASADLFVSGGKCAGLDIKSCQKSIESKDTNRTLYEIIAYVDSNGHFNNYKQFANEVDEGDIDFQWLLSIAGGVVLLYVGISYCFDMALRMIKLVFYQLIAPIPVFARVIPDTKLSGSFNEWIKVTLACYFEVYVRIFVLYFVVFLCTTMLKSGNFLDKRIYEYGTLVGLFGKAFILMGIVMFMKQAPKLISEVTGIDTGNMKLGIKEKLKEGGFFTAGSVLGAGATALTRNATNAVKNIKNKWATASGRERARLIAGGLGSTIAGGASGMVRGGRAGWGAGSFSDMSSAAGSGAKGAVDARDRRAAYRASHGGHFISIPKDQTTGKRSLIVTGADGKKKLNVEGTLAGHVADTFDTVGRWAGFNNIQALQEENAQIDLTSSKIDSVVDSSRELIKSQFLTKGKTYGFGVSGQNSAGIKYDADTYRRLSDLRDRATTTGDNQSLKGLVSAAELARHRADTLAREGVEREDYTADEIQRIFGKYENDYAKEVANTAFLGKSSYDSYVYADKDKKVRAISFDEEAAFSSVRSAAEDARHQLERAYGSRVVAKANEIAKSAGSSTMTVEDVKNGDLKVTGDTPVDKFGTAAKIIKNENAAEISKIQQREKDKEGK